MWDSSADHKHNTVLLIFADAIEPLRPAGFITAAAYASGSGSGI